MISLQPITEKNFEACTELNAGDDERFVYPNVYSNE